MQWTIDILQVTGVDLQAGMKEAVIATMKMDHHIMTEVDRYIFTIVTQMLSFVTRPFFV
jgi:hypothetical protein